MTDELVLVIISAKRFSFRILLFGSC